ncbi:DUF2889 domain-containing protein [Actinomadura rugatobispora]|uniref:DUF2889 domain-containing protein n=1 Tax=Actinomadura rugatobispora TaxID=1994 RepID=A0ABW0ZZN2_9ACTN|nr:hypothetical protein GCM10010200_103820 [Actinomadura rugatobispora]
MPSPNAGPDAVPDGAAPPRLAGSVRRTTSLHMQWPGELGTALTIDGFARDLVTSPDGSARVRDQDQISLRVDPDTRVVQRIEGPERVPRLGRLVGARCGGGLRAVLADVVPEEREAGTALHLLLDDLAGASLIAPFALTRFLSDDRWRARFGPRKLPPGVCLGWGEGTTAHRPDEPADRTRDAGRVPDPADPLGWHEFPDHDVPTTRRLRRIDIRLEQEIQVDAWFQDSASEPAGGRVAVHEYRVRATADRDTGALLTLDAVPRVLPYPECPLAVGNLGRLLGTPLTELRGLVPRTLRGVEGCTHLNDAVRALADVPALAAALGS